MAKLHTIHGMHKTPQYTCYKNMIRRCHAPKDPHYANHGGRGIYVCDKWREGFASFWEDMKEGYGPGMQIERVDNNGPYSKGNCIWGDRYVQQNNKRNNNLISAFGKSLTSYAWSRETGVGYETIRARIRLGWTPEDAVSQPTTRKKYYNREKALRHENGDTSQHHGDGK